MFKKSQKNNTLPNSRFSAGKKIFVFLFLANCLLPIANSFSQGAWTQKADFGGGNTNYAVGFSIGTKGYIGTGSDSTGSSTNVFWQYDPATDTWTQKANFPGATRRGAAGFSIGNNGYIGTGTDLTNFYNDFWTYNATSNIWTQKANFPGTPRFYATGFSIGTKGYIGTGDSTLGNDYLNDFWEYNVATDSWSPLAFPGVKRGPGVGFSIGTSGYFGTGNTVPFGSPTKDFWEYDQSNNTWTQKADLPVKKCGAAGFSIGNKGYVGTGESDTLNISGQNTRDFWEYTPSTNTWIRVADFGGIQRRHAVGFSINGKGYIGTGSGSKDFWEFDPNAVGISEPETKLEHTLCPNPMRETATLEIIDERAKNKEMVFELYDLQGKCAKQLQTANCKLQIEKGTLSAGTYIYKITHAGDVLATGKLLVQ